MLTHRQRVSYGIGGAVFSVKEAAYAIFVLIFYTQVLGLGGTATLPLGLGFIGLFAVPDWVLSSQWYLADWLLFWTIWIRTLVSCFSIPHLALSAEITRDYHERSRLIGMRMFFVFLTTVLIPALTLPMLFATDEHELEQGRRQEGAFFAAFAFASKLASGIGPLYGGVVLDLIGLQRGMLPGTIDQGPLDALALATLFGILIPLLVSWHFSLKVSLSEQRLKHIQVALAQREVSVP